MTRKLSATFLSLIIITVFLAAGCGKGNNKIAAVVNGQIITQKQIEDRMAKLNPNYRRTFANDPNRLLEQMVMEEVLVQEARRRGLERDAEVEKLLREAQKQIILGRLLEVIRNSDISSVTDQEITQFYEAHKASLVAPETFRASHVLVDKEETARKALDRIKGGESFDKVAKELSLDTSKDKGGDIGYFTKGQLIPEFEAAVARLKPGDMSGVVKTPLGYHIILLTERKAAGQESLEDVKDQIRRQLVEQHQQQKTESMVKELRSKAQARYVLPFHDGTPSPVTQSKVSEEPSASK